MSAPKWTPGPWERGIQGDEDVVIAPKSKPAKRVICRVNWRLDSIVQGANARLIAAAPELYAEHYADDQLLMKVATVILNDKIADHLPSGLREEFEARLRRGTPALHKAESEGRL